LLGERVDAAEFERSGAARQVGRQSGGDLLVDEHVKDGAHFGIEVTLLR
jgi:hypothetical protein